MPKRSSAELAISVDICATLFMVKGMYKAFECESSLDYYLNGMSHTIERLVWYQPLSASNQSSAAAYYSLIHCVVAAHAEKPRTPAELRPRVHVTRSLQQVPTILAHFATLELNDITPCTGLVNYPEPQGFRMQILRRILQILEDLTCPLLHHYRSF